MGSLEHQVPIREVIALHKIEKRTLQHNMPPRVFMTQRGIEKEVLPLSKRRLLFDVRNTVLFEAKVCVDSKSRHQIFAVFIALSEKCKHCIGLQSCGVLEQSVFARNKALCFVHLVTNTSCSYLETHYSRLCVVSPWKTL